MLNILIIGGASYALPIFSIVAQNFRKK